MCNYLSGIVIRTEDGCGYKVMAREGDKHHERIFEREKISDNLRDDVVRVELHNINAEMRWQPSIPSWIIDGGMVADIKDTMQRIIAADMCIEVEANIKKEEKIKKMFGGKKDINNIEHIYMYIHAVSKDIYKNIYNVNFLELKKFFKTQKTKKEIIENFEKKVNEIQKKRRKAKDIEIREKDYFLNLQKEKRDKAKIEERILKQFNENNFCLSSSEKVYQKDKFCILKREEVDEDWNYYSKGWHRAHGPKKTVLRRFLEARIYKIADNKESIIFNVQKTIDVENWHKRNIDEALQKILN